MNPIEQFENEKKVNIAALGNDKKLQQLGINFLIETAPAKYSYNFSWMGRPIIAYPQDMIAMQEIIWEVKPDLIIETGVAHGGSIVYYASLLELIGNDGLVVGIGKINIACRIHRNAFWFIQSGYQCHQRVAGRHPLLDGVVIIVTNINITRAIHGHAHRNT